MDCPLPASPNGVITTAHGGGGRWMHQLLESVFFRLLDDPSTRVIHHDAALLSMPAGRLAFTTDSYVVQPLFFPGGDIGKLAVTGTLNDLAMAGARPRALSAGFILEEGFLITDLERIVESMADAALRAGVRIETGDTKVVEKGRGDGIYINTSAVGIIEHGLTISPASIEPGDAVVISGDPGRHATAVLEARGEFALATGVQSDVECVWPQVKALLDSGLHIHCLRDLTRGGLASALVEFADAARCSIILEEGSVPVHPGVEGTAELLGLDPFYLASEGRFVLVLPESEARRACEIIREVEPRLEPAKIGGVSAEGRPGVRIRTALGVHRPLDMLSGEQLPRIC